MVGAAKVKGALLPGLAQPLLSPFLFYSFSPPHYLFFPPFLPQALRGVSSLSPLWRRCIRATDDALGFEVGRVFVRAVFSQDVLAASKTMVGKIRQSFIDGLEKVHWMDATTKAAASAKASEMVDKFG